MPVYSHTPGRCDPLGRCNEDQGIERPECWNNMGEKHLVWRRSEENKNKKKTEWLEWNSNWIEIYWDYNYWKSHWFTYCCIEVVEAQHMPRIKHIGGIFHALVMVYCALFFGVILHQWNNSMRVNKSHTPNKNWLHTKEKQNKPCAYFVG